MEELEKILEFLKVKPLDDDFDYIYGCGDGYGSGSGSGFDDGSGYGNGDGYGSGDRDGFDYGYGDGSGSGSGYDQGSGVGYGSGMGSGSISGYGSSVSGYGSGSVYGFVCGFVLKIKKIKENLVYYVNGIPTIFDHICGNVAKGKIVNTDDFSLKECYIVKNEYYFAYGETLEVAKAALKIKEGKNERRFIRKKRR